MYPAFWEFADTRVETEHHNSVAAYIVDRIRRHMDEIMDFSRQVGTSGKALGLSYSGAEVGKEVEHFLKQADEETKPVAPTGKPRASKPGRRRGTS